MTTTAKINAKGTKGTGITPELAADLHANLGKTLTAIIELRSESRGEKLNGDETVNLAIQTLEIVPDDMGAAEHVREIAKAVHSNRMRAQDGPQLQLPGDSPEPTVEEVTQAGARHRTHPYLSSGLSTDDNAICDVCGLLETAPIHSTQGVLPDPFAIPDDEPTELDERPSDDELAQLDHVHVAGECIKNRHGDLCEDLDDEHDDGDDTETDTDPAA